MNFRKFALITFACLLSCSAFASPIDGAWEGKLDTAGGSLRVVFHISSMADGVLRTTMDSPDQGAFGIPVDSTTFADDTLHCEVKSISGRFEGKLNAADRTINGYWSQFGMATSLKLQPQTVVARKRPQEPSKPYPYSEEEVRYENAKAGVQFAGTFTKPNQGKRFPAVLLITGSGPQNRDEELMEHKPFLVIADYLTRRGIAVLRVDDRGVGGTSRGAQEPSSEDLAEDALAGVAYLKSRHDVDLKHIGLIGHSEGGLIAPLAATQSKDVAFIVLLAGPGVTGAELLIKQGDAIAAAQGVPPAAREMNARLQKKLIDIAVQSSDEASALAAFDSYWTERTHELSSTVPQSTLTALGEQLRPQVKGLMSPWLQYFLRHDPAQTLQKVRCPVLAVNGTLDTQVVAAQNLPPIEAALKAGGNKDYLTKELPGLNHLFQAAKTGAPSEYINIEETINPIALQIVGDWVVQHAGISSKH